MMTSDDWIHLGILAALIPIGITAVQSFIQRGRMQERLDTLWDWWKSKMDKEKT